MLNRNNNKNRLNVFIAGSKVLSEQRNILRAVLMKLQSLFHIMIETKTFEDFSDSIIKGGQQKELYNKYLSDEADVAVFVLDSYIGGFTKEEFDVAYKSYIQNKFPKIFIYCNREGGKINGSIDKFKEELNTIHQYYTEYVNNKDLEILFDKSITEYLVNTFFKGRLRSPKEQIAFELACQKLSNTLFLCLGTIDQLGYVVKKLSNSWNNYKIEHKNIQTKEGELKCKSELLRDLNHYLSEVQRIFNIFPPSAISISEECIEQLASQVKDISEISMLSSMYSSYFGEILDFFNTTQDYISDSIHSPLKSRIIDIYLQGFSYLANGFFYTLLVYLTQLPEENKNNLKEFQTRWLIYPKNVSINLPPDEYERFAKRELDEYEKMLIELKAITISQDEQLDILKQQIAAIRNK